MPQRQSTREAREALHRAGFESLAEWARARGFNPDTVQVTVRRWWARRGERPHGGIAREIMRRLAEDLAGSGRER